MEYQSAARGRWGDEEMQEDLCEVAVQVARAAVAGELGEEEGPRYSAVDRKRGGALSKGDFKGACGLPLLSRLPTPGRAQGPLMPWDLGLGAAQPAAAHGAGAYRERLQARGQQAMHRTIFPGAAQAHPMEATSWNAAAEMHTQQLQWEYQQQQQQQQQQQHQLLLQQQQQWMQQAVMSSVVDQAQMVQSPSCLVSPPASSLLASSPLVSSPLASGGFGGLSLPVTLTAPEGGRALSLPINSMPISGQQSPLAASGGITPQELLATLMPQGMGFFNSDEVAEQLRAAAPDTYDD